MKKYPLTLVLLSLALSLPLLMLARVYFMVHFSAEGIPLLAAIWLAALAWQWAVSTSTYGHEDQVSESGRGTLP